MLHLFARKSSIAGTCHCKCTRCCMHPRWPVPSNGTRSASLPALAGLAEAWARGSQSSSDCAALALPFFFFLDFFSLLLAAACACSAARRTVSCSCQTTRTCDNDFKQYATCTVDICCWLGDMQLYLGNGRHSMHMADVYSLSAPAVSMSSTAASCSHMRLENQRPT